MRSHSLKRRSFGVRNRPAFAILSFTILSAGTAGLTRFAHAQDPAASAAPATPVAPAAPGVSPSAPTFAEQVQNIRGNQAQRQQLDALLKQRSDLDRQIDALRRQLGERSSNVFRFNGDRGLFLQSPQSRKLTEAEKRSVEEAMRLARSASQDARRQAQDAMRQAQEALRKAQQAMQEASRAALRGGSGTFVMPALPTLPDWSFRFNQDRNVPFLKTPNSPEWKAFQDRINKEFVPNMRQFEQGWKKWQPEIEKRTRKFEERIQNQQRDQEKHAPQPSEAPLIPEVSGSQDIL